MRRVLPVLIALVLIGGAGYGGYRYGMGKGNTDGLATAASDRSAFFATRAAPGGVGGGAGSPGAGSRGAGGGSVVPGGMGAPGAGGSPGAGGRNNATPGAGGSPGAGRMGAQNGVAGRVTPVSGQTLTIQSAMDSMSVNVSTTGMTVFAKLVTGTASDLKVNDFVAVQGDKTGDTTYTARTITGVNAQTLAGAAMNGFPGAAGGPPAGVPGMTGFPGGPGMGGNGGQIVGRITQMGATTMTLAALDGTMITVTTMPGTKVQTTQPATLADIKMGDMLVVVGERSGDTVTARVVTDQG